MGWSCCQRKRCWDIHESSEFTWFAFIPTPAQSSSQTVIQSCFPACGRENSMCSPVAPEVSRFRRDALLSSTSDNLCKQQKNSLQKILERIWPPQRKFAHMSNTVCMFYWLKIRGASVAGQQQSVRQLHAEQICRAWKAQHLRQLCANTKCNCCTTDSVVQGKQKYNKQTHTKTPQRLQRYLQNHVHPLDNTRQRSAPNIRKKAQACRQNPAI